MEIEKILAAVGAIIALIAGAFIKGRSDGKQEHEVKIAKQQAEVAKQVKEIENEVAKKTSDSVDDELKRRWVRK